MGALPWLARTQRDYARLLTERRDPQHASELIAAAMAIEGDLGITFSSLGCAATSEAGLRQAFAPDPLSLQAAIGALRGLSLPSSRTVKRAWTRSCSCVVCL